MFTEALDELRTWPTDRLHAARDEAVREERRWQVRRLAFDRVIDERGATGDQDTSGWVMTRDRVSVATARTEIDVARRLEVLPAIAAAAERGELSLDQLAPLVQLATSETDAEWAVRGRRAAPSDLQRMARVSRAVTAEEAAARKEARELSWWRSPDGGMLRIRGAIPDVAGAIVESVFEKLINDRRPARGEGWDTRAHRGADALVDLCRAFDASTGTTKRRSWKPTVVVHVGSDAQPAVNGIPIAHETVAELVADGARVRTVRDDDTLAPADGEGIPRALRDYLEGRDPQCRRPGCERTFGLEAHHLVPRSAGGPTDRTNMAMVCRPDHQLLIPNGRYVLEGDPERPDGLTWHRLDESGQGTGDARAGPAA